MNSKSKIVLSISVLCLVVAISVLSLVSVWALGKQNLKTDINVGYVAKQVLGTATAMWKEGDSGDWQPMTDNGQPGGNTTITFNNEQIKTANLSPTKTTIELEDAEFVIFKYTFTNSGNNAYSVTLTFTQTNKTNISTYVTSTTEDITDFATKITGEFTTTAATNINAGETKSMYIRAQIDDTSAEADFEGDFAFVLDGSKEIYVEDGLIFNAVNNEATLIGIGDETLTTFTIPGTVNGMPVVAIGDGAFENNTVIKGLDMPESITSIGKNAFKGCSSLLDLRISKNVKSVGDSAFVGCDNLIGIIILSQDVVEALTGTSPDSVGGLVGLLKPGFSLAILVDLDFDYSYFESLMGPPPVYMAGGNIFDPSFDNGSGMIYHMEVQSNEQFVSW